MKIKCTECEYLIMHHRSGGDLFLVLNLTGTGSAQG